MKSQKAVADKLNFYKNKLSLAIQEKEEFEYTANPDIDIIIFALIDKIETLLWVLDAELPDFDLLEQITRVEH